MTNFVDGAYDSGQPDVDIITAYEYDNNGNVTRTILLPGSAEEQATCTVYDALNRVERTVENCVTATPENPGSYSSDPDKDLATRFAYDDAGNQETVIDPKGRTTAYDYDALNRVITITHPLPGASTSYGYDLVGNRTVVTNARGFPTTYDYDELNRQVRATDPLNNITEYGYDPVGNRTVITDANTLAGSGGAVTNFVYDNVNRLTDIDYSDTTPDVHFTYDNVGNRETMTDGTGTTSYSYDDLYRLTGVTGPQFNVGYAYDAAGNRTGLIYPNSFGSVSYQYDDANRLDLVTASWLGGQFDYNYDEAYHDYRDRDGNGCP